MARSNEFSEKISIMILKLLLKHMDEDTASNIMHKIDVLENDAYNRGYDAGYDDGIIYR